MTRDASSPGSPDVPPSPTSPHATPGQTAAGPDLARLDAALAETSAEMLGVLQDLLRLPSVSGAEAGVAEYCAAWGRRRGLEVDLFETDEQTLAHYPESRLRHLPLAGRPTCVLRLRGAASGEARSLLLNAHTDVVPPGDTARWTHPPFAGEAVATPPDRPPLAAPPGAPPGAPRGAANLRLFGRGACDDKGPLVSGLWALSALATPSLTPEGDVLIELIPGEEDCVGLGSLTSVARGVRADALVVLEPTEGTPTCASRSGLRFEIIATGRSVHGTVKWLGQDAIAIGSAVLDALRELEEQYNDPSADPLFAGYPVARPITVDTVRGGEWQGMVADRCTIAGYFDLLPGDDLAEWMPRLRRDVVAEVHRRLADRGLPYAGAAVLEVTFPEQYTGHRISPDEPICQAAARATGHRAHPNAMPAWRGFNSGCEAGLRQRLQGTPTLVWGPGSLAQAHAADEYVDFSEVMSVARQLGLFARAWCRKVEQESRQPPGQRPLGQRLA